ncbi:hypothetical protein [Pseudodonghicola xiamenensis]|uniref:Mor transcription activator family protein n=1 Tax=Pseudodonghicola xiamenensis TaxID=337702 RepID=A0A8J3H9I0_9RHOB|nr:hypothetical protein [Pseudodonghicola xiamenensis]GHH04079.1 hypothetical protein GCM10010961_42320 [Pseudodonghicola xiamenensis]
MRVRSTANVIAILNEACGKEASSALVEAFGGRRIDIPLTVSGRLVEALGQDITAVLVDHFGGCKLDVPSWGHAERIQKSLRLKHDVMTSDLSANELAARHGVTSMWVRKLRSELCGTSSSQPAKD